MDNHKTNVQYIIILVIFSVLAVFTFLTSGFQATNDMDSLAFKNYVVTDRVGRVAGIEAERANIAFDRGLGTVVNIDVGIISGETTVLELLEELDESMGLNVKSKKYDFGTMIESLLDFDNGVDDKYWQYYVNGQLSMNSVDQQKVFDGDKIEFKFEESNF